jgi:hypothetical protein
MDKKPRQLRKHYLLFVLIIAVIVAIIIICDKQTFWTNNANLATIVGSAISIIGLGITAAEIFAISDIVILTQTVVNETKEKIKTRDDLAEISGIVQTINGSLEDINQSRFISATLKLREVKKSLVTIYDVEKLERTDTVERIHYDYIDQTINSIGHLRDNATFSQQKKEAIHIQLNQVTNKLLLLNKKIKQIII